MLNLKPIFSDAVKAVCEDASLLKTPPLPAAVFLMQQDVINYYRLSLTHYFPLTLHEDFLQNSSIGPPYEKWAKFTNDDFEALSSFVLTLVRYTVRLIRETTRERLAQARQFDEMTDSTYYYEDGIYHILNDQKSVGIRIEPENTLIMTPWDSASEQESEDNPILGFATSIVGSGEALPEYKYNIADRSIIDRLKTEGLKEIEELCVLKSAFGNWCNDHYSTNPPATDFDHLCGYWQP